MHDARHDLEHLPDANLFDVARNPAAVHRLLAIRILVERGSLYAGRDDIADEARQLVIEDPIVLKKIDPASGIQALKLSGIIDIPAGLQAKSLALTSVVSAHGAQWTHYRT